MAEIRGFWSYVHADDQADGGRISQLARDVQSQFEMLTGESIELFLDLDSIEWGEAWRSKIESTLSLVAFFIPVLTPRYFLSAESRGELQFFARRATDLGIEELVLPVLYVEVEALHEATPDDDLVALVKTFQWVDWRDIRFAGVETEAYRRAVAELAARLVEANRRAEQTDIATTAARLEQTLTGQDEEAPGALDQLDEFETTMPEWSKTLDQIGDDIASIGRLMQAATADVTRADSHGKGFAARLSVARRLARELTEPTDRVNSLGNRFASQLHVVDVGVRIIIDRAPVEIAQNPSARERFCEFFDAIQTLTEAAREGLESTRGMVDAISPLEALSRDLRPPLRRLRQGLTVMLEARDVIEEWSALIERSGVPCGGDPFANGDAGVA